MGNKLGWFLAAVLLVIVAVAVFTAVFPSRSRATADTLAPGVLELHEPSVSVSRAIGAVPDGPGNAAADFVMACDVWKRYEAMLKRVCGGRMGNAKYVPPAGAVAALKQIDSLVAGAMNKSAMKFVLSKYTTQQLEVDYWYKPAVRLEYLGDALGALATYYVLRGDADRAAEVLKHRVVLGWHMVNERALLYMVIYGLRLQVEALNALEDVYRTAGGAYLPRIIGVREYCDSLLDVRSAMKRKRAVIWPGNCQPSPGDIFNIVENDADRSCRVQGVLALAFLRFTTANRGDRNYTDELIARYVKSDEPLLAAAARAARDWQPETK